MLEGDDLLDGDLLAGDRVGGRRHHAVRALAEELEVVVPGPDLQERNSRPSAADEKWLRP